MDLRLNLEASGSEYDTGKEDRGKPARVQDANVKVPSGLEGGHAMQGEESGGGHQVVSGK